MGRLQCLGDLGFENSFGSFLRNTVSHPAHPHQKPIMVGNYRGCTQVVFTSNNARAMFAKLKQKTIEEKVVSPRSVSGRQPHVQVSTTGPRTRLPTCMDQTVSINVEQG